MPALPLASCGSVRSASGPECSLRADFVERKERFLNYQFDFKLFGASKTYLPSIVVGFPAFPLDPIKELAVLVLVFDDVLCIVNVRTGALSLLLHHCEIRR